MLEEYLEAGRIVKILRQKVMPLMAEGTRLLEIAELIERETAAMGAVPAFPCNVSLNDTASHDTPSGDDRRELSTGDIVKLDMGACVNGYIADTAFSIGVNTKEHDEIIEAATRALTAGISAVKPGTYTSEIGMLIEASARDDGYQTLKGLYGHSMGRYTLHGGLNIPNYEDGTRVRIKEGDVLAIEPFLTAGTGEIVRQDKGNIYQVVRDNPVYARGDVEMALLERAREYKGLPFAGRWLQNDKSIVCQGNSAAIRRFPVLVEKDGKPVAQAEHTVIVVEDGCIIIT